MKSNTPYNSEKSRNNEESGDHDFIPSYEVAHGDDSSDDDNFNNLQNEVPVEEMDDDDDDDGDGDEMHHTEREIERDDSILTFKGHTAPVFSCSIHPKTNICATGGEDDKVYVWDMSTGHIIHEIKDHKDTVIAAYFSYDGNYLATGDMAGELQVFKLSDDDFKKIWEFSMGDMCWLKWHTAANVLMAGADSGEVYIWRIPSGECKILPGNGKKCETADLSSDGKKLLTGYGDGTVKLWDIKNCAVIVEINENNFLGHHTECVSSVSCDPNNALYLSGSEDGSVILLSNNGPLCKLNQSAGPVEAVAFCPDSNLRVAATGTLHGEVAIYDVVRQMLSAVCENTNVENNENGIITLKWYQQTLICGTMNGDISGFDGRNGKCKFNLYGHTGEIYDMFYNYRDNILLTASEDCTAKIFKINI